MKGLSKFDCGRFFGGYDEFAVSAQRYPKEYAIEEAKKEADIEVGVKPGQYTVSKAFVKWRAGIDEDGDPVVGWWLEYSKRKIGSCPVYAFHRNGNGENREKFNKEPDGWDGISLPY